MIEITIPKLGLTMESANLVSWQFQSGDAVKQDDILLVIETDKVSYEVPSPADGILHPVAREGETYAVGETVGYVAETREEYQDILKQYPLAKAGGAEAGQPPPDHGAAHEARPPLVPLSDGEGRLRASPLARAMAAAHDLDLHGIEGSGPGGRIVRVDILRALEEPSKAPMALGKEVQERIPIEGIRRVIFNNMHLSLTQSAQLTLHTEASAEAVINLRQRLSTGDTKVSYNAILMKLTAAALRQHPRINASVEKDTVLVWKQIHMGIAMEADDALIVPVVRNPDIKGIRQINEEILELIEKTRTKRLSPDDLANGTFTLSNLGFGDIDHFTPIIRPPESAILGVGRLTRKPVVKGEQVVAEARIGLSLTFDHRIIDGAPAARFLKTVKGLVEEPLLMIA